MTETENNVKEYLKKYNLEDELSNAVNQAIKLQSDDPYRVISDYLKQFAKVCAATLEARGRVWGWGELAGTPDVRLRLVLRTAGAGR